MATVAQETIIPREKGIFRTIFLYTGQGESTLMVIPDGINYRYVLIDSDLDFEPYEVNIISMFEDLFADDESLDVFINTHPHKDHLGGINEIYEKIGIKEIWHSNHQPGAERHKGIYGEFLKVIKGIGKEYVFHLKGSDVVNRIHTTDDAHLTRKIGDVDFIVLSPAQYLCEDIEEQDADERDRRIHEQCAVIKFFYGDPAKSILITGDSDKTAWMEHITDHHSEHLPSTVLSASHHGSRTFFKHNSDDEDVYKDHISKIAPSYVVVSAPKQEDSPHGHPDDDAMELYNEHASLEVLHLGEKKECVIVDIYQDGTIYVKPDQTLVEKYGKKPEGKEPEKSSKPSIPAFIPQTTRLDNKPMGGKLNGGSNGILHYLARRLNIFRLIVIMNRLA